MYSDLTKKQIKFNMMRHALEEFMVNMGYHYILETSYRTPEEAEAQGFAKSLHTLCLAVDIGLFKNEEYLTKTSDHLECGEYWESMGGTWGGRFDDGCHYSLEHNGIK